MSQIQLALALREQLRRRAKDSLHFFFEHFAWPILEPGTEFVDNWHLHVVAEHLEAVTNGDITRLLVNIPFRTSKSTLVSVAWPAWVWINKPSHRWLCGSYAEKLAIRDSLAMRRLITHPKFRAAFGDSFGMAADQNQKVRFQNDKNGYRIAFGMTGGVMGDGGDTILLDDPHDRQGAHSEAERENSLVTYDQAISTRLNDPVKSAIVVIMQRLHEHDLSGHVLKQGGWEHLMLPMRYEPARRAKTKLGLVDPRTIDGELLWPTRFPDETVAKLETILGNYGAAGQLQQRPAPDGSGIITTGRFQLWRGELPPLEFVLQSYDTAFTASTQNDPTACVVFGVFTHEKKRCALLLDVWAEHLEYPELRRKVIADWSAKYGGNPKEPGRLPSRVDSLLVEDKGSGIALIKDLRQAHIPAIPYNPGRADKISRAHIVAPLLDLELFYVLESKKEPGKPVSWARDFIAQCNSFPNDEHDDMVDAFTQGLRYLRDAKFLDLPVAAPDEVEDYDYHRDTKRRVNPYGA